LVHHRKNVDVDVDVDVFLDISNSWRVEGMPIERDQYRMFGMSSRNRRAMERRKIEDAGDEAELSSSESNAMQCMQGEWSVNSVQVRAHFPFSSSVSRLALP
jgi:hypothetical protein